MKGRLLFGLVTGLAILSAGSSSVLAQSKHIVQNLPKEKQLYGQAQSPVQAASLFRPLLPQLQRETNVPILLPSDLEFFSQQRQRIYAEGRERTVTESI
ncbi:MAG: hypothetical protein KME19_10855 [Microcoleus vaginatus WJT46-NPBG5]|nr:hypothetical protein [Microcoleus vaginatus WJT46-NPBG5]